MGKSTVHSCWIPRLLCSRAGGAASPPAAPSRHPGARDLEHSSSRHCCRSKVGTRSPDRISPSVPSPEKRHQASCKEPHGQSQCKSTKVLEPCPSDKWRNRHRKKTTHLHHLLSQTLSHVECSPTFPWPSPGRGGRLTSHWERYVSTNVWIMLQGETAGCGSGNGPLEG